ncbi:mechanosensitive ion channel family protein [Pelagicoccus sp. SDUM812002]|uniref:mechanosensitive ion channel family protein n=1 Tax=Pelagicoccus sp. SDUM812002 TaxID=3041266 RepID=UPI00280DCAA8|nr:mechanosensitive ion channel family protein [Pelagicoccus sp. SDUM812002]MDQ8187616.1 mechanosensitive ion channel family protein [Pelagicoccus sp. SDUM812002]
MHTTLAWVILFLGSVVADGQDDTGGELSGAEGAAGSSSGLDLGVELRERLSRIEGLESVELSEEGGVVTLEGEVSDRALQRLAEEVSSSHEGVIEVRNEVVLGGPIGVRLEGAMERTYAKVVTLVNYVPLFLLAVLIVVAFVVLGRWVGSPAVMRHVVEKNRFLREVVAQAVRMAIMLVGLVIALEVLDATALMGAVFGAAGVAGLAIGFAFRDLIENYVASMLLSIRHPFRPHDHVVIDGHEGKVVSLDTRATTLMTLDGNHLRLPNAMVFKSVMLNYTRNAERRFDFAVGVGTGEDLVEARRIGVRTLSSMEGVLAEPAPLAVVAGLADSSVTISFFAWVNQTEHSFVKVKGEAIRRVKLALEAAGMDLPEPIHRVLIERRKVAVPVPAPQDSQPNREGAISSESEDVSPDHSLDQQVREETERLSDRNLLLDDVPSE